RYGEKARAFILEFADRFRLSDDLGKRRIERRHDSREDAVGPVATGIRKEKTLSKIPECGLPIDVPGILAMRIRRRVVLEFSGRDIIEYRQECLFRRLYEIIGSPQSLHQGLKISRGVRDPAGSRCFGWLLLGVVGAGGRQQSNRWSLFGACIRRICRRWSRHGWR